MYDNQKSNRQHLSGKQNRSKLSQRQQVFLKSSRLLDNETVIRELDGEETHEAQLVRECRNNNITLLFKFFEDKKNYRLVLSMCRKVCNGIEEDAEDMIHDIFILLSDAASKIDFPVDKEEALSYIYRVVANHQHQRFRKTKNLSQKVDISEAFDVADESNSNPAIMRKLEKLDKLIRESNLFSLDQLKLWECLYEFRGLEATAKILGKRKIIVSTLKSKLFAKIREHFKLEDLS